MRKFCLLVLCCVVLLKAAGQAGRLDPTFGNKGIQATAFMNNANLADERGRVVLTNAKGDLFIVVQVGNFTSIAKHLPDGRLDAAFGDGGYAKPVNVRAASATMQGDKILVAGSIYNPVNVADFVLVRYTANGVLDTSFGEHGISTTDFHNSDDEARSLVVQGDNIVVAGYTYFYDDNTNPFALARYTMDGSLDSTFGVNGKVTTDFGDFSSAQSVAVQADKIVVVGYSGNYTDFSRDVALARYTMDGILDSSFGVNGKVTTDFNHSDDYASSVAMQDGNIIVAGSIGFFDGEHDNRDVMLARYTVDGQLDATFGAHGKVTTDFDFDDEATSIAMLGDKIIMVGYAGNALDNQYDFALARYTADGKLDSSFGVNGRTTTDFSNGSDQAYSIALQRNQIIVAGYSGKYPNYDYALARFMVDGSLDPSFGENGKLTGHFPSSQTYFTSTAIQGNKIIAAGYALNDNNNNDFVIARFREDGALDATFGVNGIVTTDFGGTDYANAVALQGDNIIIGGNTLDLTTYTSQLALSRYTADGELDTSFGVNGRVTTNAGFDARSIAVQGDKILVGGSALLRYTADGALDASFGAYGRIATSFVVSSIILQGNKILLAGTAELPGYSHDVALARYTADGTLDATFGVQGTITTDFNHSDDLATSMVLLGDKIVVGGYTYVAGATTDFILVLYTADGALDSSFGVHGRLTTDFNHSWDYARSMALQNNKILVGGNTGTEAYLSDGFAIARYTANGALDASFGNKGKVITHLGGISSLRAIAPYQNRLYAVGSLTTYTYVENSYGLIAAYRLEAPEPTISIADVKVSESKKFAIATVRLSAPTNKMVRVHFTTHNKTAIGNEDYLPINGPLLFIPGVNTTAKIVIPLIDDHQQEDEEQFDILLFNAHHATIQDSIGVVTIVDNDDALITKQEDDSFHIKVSPNPSAGAFTVQLQGSNLKQPVSIRVYDVKGRLTEVRENISIGQRLCLGNRYTPGSYMIKVVQGNLQVHTTVVKLGK